MIPYFDAHCDTLWRCMSGESQTMPEMQQTWFAASDTLRENNGHIDLKRGTAFLRYAQFFALFSDPAEAAADGLVMHCRRMHDFFLTEMERNADRVRHCRTAAEVEQTVQQGKAAAMLSIEGGDLLGCDPALVPMAADWGVRLCNPVWNRANVLSGTNREDSERGLSDKGRDFIRQLECHNIYTDVSHLSDAGFWDLVHMTRRPIVASHSNSRSVCPHRRNLTDDQFCAIRDTGGVVGLNFYLHFVGGDTMDDLVHHVEHFLNMGGEDTLCIGGDLDGCEVLAAGMQGIQDVPKLYTALEERGYPEELLEKLFWNNLIRLL